MKKFLSLAVFALVVGCSNLVINNYDECMTIGLDRNLHAIYNDSGITIGSNFAVSTAPELYFYINNEYAPSSITVVSISDSSIVVDGSPLTNLKCIFLQDVNNNWYIQVVRGSSNLSM